jgi:hypothetical protein
VWFETLSSKYKLEYSEKFVAFLRNIVRLYDQWLLKNVNYCPLRRVCDKFINRKRLVIYLFEKIYQIWNMPLKLEPDAQSAYFCML